jgi:hypothetical protein
MYTRTCEEENFVPREASDAIPSFNSMQALSHTRPLQHTADQFQHIGGLGKEILQSRSNVVTLGDS